MSLLQPAPGVTELFDDIMVLCEGMIYAEGMLGILVMIEICVHCVVLDLHCLQGKQHASSAHWHACRCFHVCIAHMILLYAAIAHLINAVQSLRCMLRGLHADGSQGM